MPRFELTNAQFSEKYPLTEPIASRYIGPDSQFGPIRVVRDHMPMSFEKGLRITSSRRLRSYYGDEIGGGWGHAISHLYNSADGIKSYQKGDSPNALVELWKRAGSRPIRPDVDSHQHVAPFALAAGEVRTIYDRNQAAAIIGIEAQTAAYQRAHLKSLRIRAFWDGSPSPDVDANFGCFFLE